MARILSQKETNIFMIHLAGDTLHRHCPFCGSEDTRVFLLPDIASYTIICDTCGARGPIKEDTERAWVYWNIREDDDDE